MSSRPAAETEKTGPRSMWQGLGAGGEATTVRGACVWMASHPLELLRRWNWKSALMSSLVRGSLFFATNLQSGMRAAAGAMLAEFVLRSATTGFYGAITQAFRRAEPAWAAATASLLILPTLSHSLEFAVHLLRGTPQLRTSIAASVAMTVCSTLVTLHVMRRGLLIVGPGSRSLVDDVRQVLVILAGGLRVVVVGPARLVGLRVDHERRVS